MYGFSLRIILSPGLKLSVFLFVFSNNFGLFILEVTDKVGELGSALSWDRLEGALASSRIAMFVNVSLFISLSDSLEDITTDTAVTYRMGLSSSNGWWWGFLFIVFIFFKFWFDW